MNKSPVNQNAIRALEQMKLEIANEFDANLTPSEKLDGATTKDLVVRAEKKQDNMDTFNPS